MKRLIFPFILFFIGLYLFWHIDYRIGVATFIWLWGNNIVESYKYVTKAQAVRKPGASNWDYKPDDSLQRRPRPQPEVKQDEQSV